MKSGHSRVRCNPNRNRSLVSDLLEAAPAVSARSRRFLSAEWRSLLMINYAVEQSVLTPWLPPGIELDLWQGQALISMVGFLFLKTRIRGISIPFHSNFDEINLRFYVKRRIGGEWRRAVVFVKEIVPRFAIAFVARTFYNERYYAMPTRHKVLQTDEGGTLFYSWKYAGNWNSMRARISGPPRPIVPGSEAEFIFEHYYGYSRKRDGGTVEYEVSHPRWQAWEAEEAELQGEFEPLYGAGFAEVLNGKARSAYVAYGSAVEVFDGKRISG